MQKIKKVGKYEIDLNDMIGKGNYGEVYKARNINTNQTLACKQLDKKKINANPYLNK